MSSSDEGFFGVRRCLLRKWPDFKGYGFNLHAEKGKVGQYVGEVDKGSPAEFAGLLEGDRIVEVSDFNISGESHQDVVNRIRNAGDSVWLLVVDKDTDENCKNNNIVITSSMNDVKCIECPESKPSETSDTPAAEQTDGDSSQANEELNDYENASNNEIDSVLAAHESNNSTNDAEDAVATEENREPLPPPPADLLPPPPPPPVDDDETDDAEQLDSKPAAEVVTQSKTETVVVDDESCASAPTAQPETNQIPDAKPTEQAQPEPSKPRPEVKASEPPASVPAPAAPAPKPAAPSPKPAEAPAPALNGSKSSEDNAVNTKKLSAKEYRDMLASKKKSDPRQANLSAKDKLAMFQRM